LVAIHANKISPVAMADGAVSVIELTAVELSVGVDEEMKAIAAGAGAAAKARAAASTREQQHRMLKRRLMCRS
jgi:hypothetical protein